MQPHFLTRRVVSSSPQRFSFETPHLRPQMMMSASRITQDPFMKDLEGELDAERNKVALLEQLNSSLKLYVSELEKGARKTEIVVQGGDDMYKEEIIKLNKIISEKNVYIQHMESQLIGTTSTKETIESKFHHFQSMNTDMEAKFELIIRENDKLITELAQKNNQLELAKVQGNESLRDYYEKRISDFEVKIQKLINENEKLVTINGSLVQEIDTIKYKNKTEENHHANAFNSFQNQIEFERKTLEERLRIEKSSFENQIKILKNQLSEVTMNYNESSSEADNLRMELRNVSGFTNSLQSKISNLEMKLQNAEVGERQISEYIERIAELEHKLSVMLSENQKLVDLIERSSLDIGMWRDKFNELTIVHSKNVEELRSHFEYENRISLEQYTMHNTNRFQVEIEKLQSQLIPLEVQMKDLIRQNNKLESSNSEYQTQVEKLKIEVSTKNFLQSENEKLDKLYKEINIVKSDLENKLERILNDNERLNNILKDRITEVEKLRAVSVTLKSTQDDLSSKNDKCLALVERCEEMNQIIEQKNTLISTLQNELKAIQSRLTLSEGQISSLNMEFKSFSEERMKLISKIEYFEKLKITWNEEKSHLETISFEYQRLQREMQMITEEKNKLMRDNDCLSREINSMTGEFKRMKSNNENNGMKFTSEVERYQSECEGYKREIFVLKSENERLIGEIQINHHKFEELERKYRREVSELKLIENRNGKVFEHKFDEEYKRLMSENQSILLRNQNLLHDNQRLVVDNEGLLKEIQFIKSHPPPPPEIDFEHIHFLKSENERLICILRDRDMELESFRRRSMGKENIPLRIIEGPQIPFREVDRRRISSYHGTHDRVRDDFDMKRFLQENEKLNNDILKKCKTLIKEY